MGDKLQFFGLLTIIIAILAGFSSTWVLPQKQLAFAPTGDGGGGSGDGGGSLEYIIYGRGLNLEV
jgi:hypothetical protein